MYDEEIKDMNGLEVEQHHIVTRYLSEEVGDAAVLDLATVADRSGIFVPSLDNLGSKFKDILYKCSSGRCSDGSKR